MSLGFAAYSAVRNLKESGGVGYVEPGKEILSASLTNGEFQYQPATYNLEVGKKYIVNLDSGSYEAVCREYIEGDIHGKWLGNMTLDTSLGSAFEDTGENFVVYWLSFGDGSPAVGYVLDSNKGNHCTVSTAETIHPIKPEYLPGVCLPVVELSTTFSYGANFTEEENAKLTAIWESGTPMVTKGNLNLGEIGSYTDCRVVWSGGTLATADIPMHAFFASFGSKLLQIYSTGDEGTWSCAIQ